MKQSLKEPKVTLVGAGPGSSDLITVRGLKAIQQADVILYDALIDCKLLEEAPASALKVYAGKRSGQHSSQQEEINIKIVEHAFSHGHVVRLKGGDPFVFGRASEEIDYIESFGIPVTVVPGVSSAIAVPSGQGIPLTKRNAASSFWVITATMKNGEFSKDLEIAAKSSATLVILMGVRKLVEIAGLVKNYRSGLTPIALIQNGTMDHEKCITGTLNNANHIYASSTISDPGIIVIGDVVAEHHSFFEDEVQRVLHSSI